MKVSLQIEIDCGVETCARARGEFCRFFGTRKFGQVPICTLFPAIGCDGVVNHTDLDEDDGWTLRCPECINSEASDEAAT